jgi:hypothetical protein
MFHQAIELYFPNQATTTFANRAAPDKILTITLGILIKVTPWNTTRKQYEYRSVLKISVQ